MSRNICKKNAFQLDLRTNFQEKDYKLKTSTFISFTCNVDVCFVCFVSVYTAHGNPNYTINSCVFSAGGRWWRLKGTGVVGTRSRAGTSPSLTADTVHSTAILVVLVILDIHPNESAIL